MLAEAFGGPVLAVAGFTSCGLVADCVSLALEGVLVVLGDEMTTSIVSSILSMEFEVSRISSRPSKPVLELFFLCFFLEEGMAGWANLNRGVAPVSDGVNCIIQ